MLATATWGTGELIKQVWEDVLAYDQDYADTTAAERLCYARWLAKDDDGYEGDRARIYGENAKSLASRLDESQFGRLQTKVRYGENAKSPAHRLNESQNSQVEDAGADATKSTPNQETTTKDTKPSDKSYTGMVTGGIGGGLLGAWSAYKLSRNKSKTTRALLTVLGLAAGAGTGAALGNTIANRLA